MGMRRLILMGMSCGVLTGCVTTGTVSDFIGNGAELDEVDLKIKRGGTELVVTSPENNKCSSPNKRGCIVAEAGDLSITIFRLKRTNNWTIAQIQICPGAAKPATPSCALTDQQAGEFYILSDRALTRIGNDGITTFPDNRVIGKFTLVNLNQVQADYFYNITVCPEGSDDPDDCISLDPPIENKGVGDFL